jgi:hypothetical protein
MGRWLTAFCVGLMCGSIAAAQVSPAAEIDSGPVTTAQLTGLASVPLDAISPLAVAPTRGSRACDDCLSPNTDLGDISDTPWSSISGDCGTGGKWYARFNGRANQTYHWDLCPNTPGGGTGNFDADIKICDHNCAILAGVHGSCTGGPGSWLPNDFHWTCPATGTYYVVIAPFQSFDRHACDGTAGLTFTLQYYGACEGQYPPNDTCDQLPAYYGGAIPTLTAGVPRTFYGDNTCAQFDCALFDAYPNAWEAFTVTGSTTGWDITLDYCGSQGLWGNSWLNLATGCPCTGYTAGASPWGWDCADGNVVLTWQNLPNGTYYYPVMLDPGLGSEGPYSLHVRALSYCSASGACDEYISRVQVGTIDYSSGCSGYANYTGLVTDMAIGSYYSMRVTNGLPVYDYDECRVWVDWNNDSDFADAGEAYAMGGSPGSGPYTATITPPAGTAPGLHRLRARITYDATPNPCGDTQYGEVEDYNINVLPPPPPPNDQCANAQVVNGPYPAVVNGTTVGATVDCPDVLNNWNAVWYKVHLPYTQNAVSVRYCGAAAIDEAGITYIDACNDCANLHVASGYAWNSCSAGGGVGIDMWWNGVSGPRDIYIPTHLLPATAFTATFNVSAAGACCFSGLGCAVLSAAACATAGGVYQGNGTSCSPDPCICAGDVNCDGVIDFGDINPFVLYLSNFSTYLATYPNCDPRNGDINRDGTYGQASFGDINPFVALFAAHPPPIPCTN